MEKFDPDYIVSLSGFPPSPYRANANEYCRVADWDGYHYAYYCNILCASTFTMFYAMSERSALIATARWRK